LALIRDVSSLVDKCEIEAAGRQAEQGNSKKSVENLRTKFAEAASAVLKLPLALAQIKDLKESLAATQATLEAAKKELLEKEELLLKKDEQLQKKDSTEEQSRQKETNEKTTRIQAYEEQITSLQKMLDVSNTELGKAKTRITTLDGKVRELMDISGKQKRQLQQQQMMGGGFSLSPLPVTLIEPPSPRVASDDDRRVYLSALKHLYRKYAKLKAELAALQFSHLHPLTPSPTLLSPTPSPNQEQPQYQDAAQALLAFRQLTPLPPPPPTREAQQYRASQSRDPQLAKTLDAWMRSSARALAQVRVVDLSRRHEKNTETRQGAKETNNVNHGASKGTSNHEKEKNHAEKRPEKGRVEELRELCKAGRQLHTRACEVLTPANFHESVSMGHFLPAHVAKMATEEQVVRFGTIAIPAKTGEKTFPSHRTVLPFEKWQQVHAVFCS